MYEKISEIPIRNDKINKLKGKINQEINQALKDIREELKEFQLEIFGNEKEDWESLILQAFNLLRLREYINRKNSFRSIATSDKDIIIYYVSSECLDIWLQDDYNFTFNFLDKIRDKKYNINTMLSDKYFGNDFTNVIDVITWKQNKQIVEG